MHFRSCYHGVILVLCILILSSGCVKKYDEKKEKDVDYTIVTEAEMSPEIKEIIEGAKEKSFRKTYTDGEYLYILIGYGAQPTSSYSIEIQEIYQSSDAIYVTSMLKGPSRAETVMEVETYPYIVLKVNDTSRTVIFQ